MSYLHWSMKNPINFNEEWLDYWYCSFVAIPSLVPCTLENYQDHDCFEHARHDMARTADFESSLTALLGDAFPSAALMGIERWLTNGIIAAVYGSSLPIPRGVYWSKGKGQHFYKYACLRQWLPWQAKRWFLRLQQCSVDDITLQYIDACRCYNMAHREFTSLYSAIVTLAQKEGQVCGAQYGLPDTSIVWRWIFLFQIIGEHLGFVLRDFPGTMSHYLGHPDGGHGHDVDMIFALQGQNISTDWGRNEGLEVLLHKYVDRCPSEFPYIASWSNGLMSNLQLQLENSVKTMKPPGLTSGTGHRALVHTHCSKAACVRPVPSNEDYIQQHVKPNCRCESRRPSREAIVAAIMRSRIPLIRLGFSGNESSLEVVEYQKGTKFLAISHVWSDGRGSLAGPEGNSLPLCQLKFLQDKCDLQREGTAWALWMDTLCIPNDKPNDEVKCRPKAIDMMNQVYLFASEVRVLCNDLLHLDVIVEPDPDPGLSFFVEHNIDSLAAIWTSSWMRRCWTFQEGVFGGKKLIFVFRDCAVNIESVLLLPLYATMSPLYEHFFTAPGIFSKVRKWEDRNRTAQIIERILREFKWRETKYLEDTVTIFAGILGLDVESIAAVDFDQPGCMTQRLKMTFERISNFPTSVLFSRVPRISLPGRSWVPQTLHIPDLITSAEISGIGGALCSNFMASVSQDGLLMWAYLAVFHRPPTRDDLPRTFRVNIDRLLSGPNTQYPMALQVSRLETLEARGPSGMLKSLPPRATNKYLAVVLRAFNLELVAREGFTTDAFIVELDEVDSGLDAFKASWSGKGRLGLWSRIKDSLAWPAVLRGRYLCAASVQSLSGAARRTSQPTNASSRGFRSGARHSTDTSHASGSIFARNGTDTEPLLGSSEMPAGHVVRRRHVGESWRAMHSDCLGGYEMHAMAFAAGTADAYECFEGIYPGDIHQIMIK